MLHRDADTVWMRTWIECAHAAVRRRYMPASILRLYPKVADKQVRGSAPRINTHLAIVEDELEDSRSVSTRSGFSRTPLCLLLFILQGIQEAEQSKCGHGKANSHGLGSFCSYTDSAGSSWKKSHQKQNQRERYTRFRIGAQEPLYPCRPSTVQARAETLERR